MLIVHEQIRLSFKLDDSKRAVESVYVVGVLNARGNQLYDAGIV